jgi:hypothetical protein
VRVEIILGAEEFLYLRRIGVELQPLFVDGLGDPIGRDARRLQPGADIVHALLRWREQLMDLFRREVLTVPSRLGVGPRQSATYHRGDRNDIHFHEKVMATVKIGLAQTDAHGQDGTPIQGLLRIPFSRKEITAFMDDIVRRGGSSEHAGGDSSQKKK